MSHAERRLGQIFGFLIGSIGLGISGWVSIFGQPVVGGVFGVGTIASLVSVFVLGRSSKSDKELNSSDSKALEQKS
ncbi:MAG: hypothetical protein VKJ06_01955 [Vampirovibrionales bacterium]|nr:hypothetical protein [Vampirovibrionales bacterium]